MDLGAYIQINEIEEIAKRNGISVPRLRGYRLMKNETPLPKEYLKKMIEEDSISIAEGLCRSIPPFNVNIGYHTYSENTGLICKKYLTTAIDFDGYTVYTGIKWNKIHGKKRKNLKFEIKKHKRAVLKQYEMFNKYCGREDVLFIHSRIGGGNWVYFKGDELVKSQPWYLDHVDDSFDSTYCDIYAKINIDKTKEVKYGSEQP